MGRSIDQLKYVPMTLSEKPLSLPKWLFEGTTNRPVVDVTGGTKSDVSRVSAGEFDTSAFKRPRKIGANDGRVRSLVHVSVAEDQRPSTSNTFRAAEARDERNAHDWVKRATKRKDRSSDVYDLKVSAQHERST